MNEMRKTLLFILLAFVAGVVTAEYKACSEIKGAYDWDLGTCLGK